MKKLKFIYGNLEKGGVYRRFLALGTVLAVLLSACGGTAKSESAAEPVTEPVAAGHYRENDLPIPKGMFVSAFFQKPGDLLELILMEELTDRLEYQLLSSSDGGVSWQESTPPWTAALDAYYLRSADYQAGGGYLLLAQDFEKSEATGGVLGNAIYVLTVDPLGNLSEKREVQGDAFAVYATPDGGYIVQGSADAVQYDKTGERQHNYPGGTGDSGGTVAGELFYLDNGAEIIAYSILTGEKKAGYTVGNALSTTGGRPILSIFPPRHLAANNAGAVYLGDSGGINLLTPENSSAKKLMEGQRTSLSDPDCQLAALRCAEDGGFFALFVGRESFSLKRFSPIDASADVKTHTLSVYSFRENTHC